VDLARDGRKIEGMGSDNFLSLLPADAIAAIVFSTTRQNINWAASRSFLERTYWDRTHVVANM